MTGLFSRIGALFGGAKQGQDGGRRDEETVVYQDLRICPTPIPEGGQWRLAAAIVKGTGDEAVEYELVRADVFASRDDVAWAQLVTGSDVNVEQLLLHNTVILVGDALQTLAQRSA